jgi:hypothetical protein
MVLMNLRASSQANESKDPGKARIAWFTGRWWPKLAWLRGRQRAERLLFLDDDPARAKVFLNEFPQAVWVETVKQCIDQLAQKWDEVHLDHDLGGRTFVDTNESDCGMEVIRWMCSEPRAHLRETQFFVHTHNSVAGLLMVLQMRSSGYKAEFRPFGFDLAEMLAHDRAGSDALAQPAAAPPAPPAGWLKALRSWCTRSEPASPQEDDPESISSA